MAIPNFTPVLDNSASNITLTYSNPLLMSTPVLLTGYAQESFIEIDEVNNTNVMIGLDGVMGSAVYPVLVTGRLTFQFNSVGAGILRTIQNSSSGSGIPFPGKLELIKVSPLNPLDITFYNFILLQPFTGLSTSNNAISNAIFRFTANLPDANILSDLTNAAALGLSIAQDL